jgi:hypothetical protein
MKPFNLTLTFDEFIETILNISNDVWDDFCRNEVTFDEYIQMSTDSRKSMFKDYLNEADMQEILDQDYWEGIFEKCPVIVERDGLELVEGYDEGTDLTEEG